MYLTKLSKKQKNLFLDVCINLSKYDSDFAKEEKDVINQLCDEMNIEPRFETNKTSTELINELASISNHIEKKIIFIELLGIVVADKKVAPKEKEFMISIVNSFGMEQSDLDEAITLVNELYDVYSKFGKFINK